MGTSTPSVVQEAEARVEAASPEAVRSIEQEVADAFNKALGEASVKGEEAAPEVAAHAAEAEPALAAEATDLREGNLVSALSGVATVAKEVKAGYKTTEFWLALAGVVSTQIGLLHLPGKYGDTITTGAFVASYILSRGIAKS